MNLFCALQVLSQISENFTAEKVCEVLGSGHLVIGKNMRRKGHTWDRGTAIGNIKKMPGKLL